MAYAIASATLISGGDMSGDLTSLALDITDAALVGLLLSSPSATRAGTATVQVSPDGSTWAVGYLPDGSAAEVTVTTATELAEWVELAPSAAAFVRVAYAAGSGSGSLTARATKKWRGALR
jgi:hypothetical protein